MPITSAARRASLASSSVQQPRAPVRYERGFMDSARWTPVTSWPASAALAAATAESTPPDMAASTRSRVIAYRVFGRPASRVQGAVHQAAGLTARVLVAGGAAGALHHLVDGGAEGVHVLLGGGVAEREPQRTAGPGIIRAHRQQHVAWLRDARRAG